MRKVKSPKKNILKGNVIFLSDEGVSIWLYVCFRTLGEFLNMEGLYRASLFIYLFRWFFMMDEYLSAASNMERIL